MEEVERARTDFPEIMPAFHEQDFLSHGGPRGQTFHNLTAMRQYLGMAVGKLRAAAEEVESIPITERRDFSLVKEPKLRAILERDYDEIQRARIGNCWKPVIILCGGAIEAVLVDLLLRIPAKARVAKGAPSKEPDVTSSSR